MILLNTLLAGGLAAVGIPILVHVLHRRRVTDIDWGAMRFLREIMVTRRRDLVIEQWLLLAIRCLALLCLALAFLRPALEPSGGDGPSIVRHGKTAAVLLLDDSASTGSGRSATRLARQRELVEDYLASLQPGDEISLLRLSQLQQPAPEPVLDPDLVRQQLAGIEPTPMASDWPALLDAGLGQLARHVNPNVEIVLIGDGQAAGWAADARARWAELRDGLQRDAEAAIGSRQRPRLLMLEPPPMREQTDLAVTDIAIPRSVVPVGARADIAIGLTHQGPQVAEDVQLQVTVDGRAIAERSLRLEPGERRSVVVPHRFAEAGSHVVSAEVSGARDAFAANDSRQFAVAVIAELPVLLVDGHSREGLDGALGFVELALRNDAAPTTAEAAPGLATPVIDDAAPAASPFRCRRVGAADLPAIDLSSYACLVLGDVAGLDNDVLAMLEAYVVSGGGLLIGLGGQTDVAHVNRFWARGGDGFLPCPLDEVVQPERPLQLGIADRSHAALAAFAGESGQAWSGSDVRRYLRLDTDAVVGEDIDVLLRFSDGAPALVERQRGLGSVVCFASSFDLSWNELCVEPAFVPLLHGLLGHLGGQVLPPRNLQPGQRLVHPVPGRAEVVAAAPDGSALPLAEDQWRGRRARVSEPLAATGVYELQVDGEAVHYAVALTQAEGDLRQLPQAQRETIFAGLGALHFGERDALREALALADLQPVELWPWLIAATVLLLIAETGRCRWQSGRERQGGGA